MSFLTLQGFIFTYVQKYLRGGVGRSPPSPPPTKKGKGRLYSITERRVPELIPVLGSLPAGDVSHVPDGRLHYFPPGPQLPSQPLRGGLVPISLLGEQRHDGCEQFA